MSFFENVSDIRLLQQLLAPEDSDKSDFEDDRLPSAGIQNSGPGQSGSTKLTEKKPTTSYFENHAAEKRPHTLEEWEELQQTANEDECSGWNSRMEPEYNIAYKQAVHTEDLYLQMGNKTASTASCEDMILEIFLPNETMKYDEMELSVTKTEINLSTRYYKMKLPLSQPIDPDIGKALYDSEKRILKLILRMDRELDFVNF